MSGIRVMVIDDERSVRFTLASFFEDWGFAVFQAISAEQALDLLAEEAIDVAVVDIRMPGMDGNAFIRKAHGLYPDLCYIIYTGSTDYHLPRDLFELGISTDQVFRKPVSDMEVLARAVVRLTENRGFGS